MWILTGHVQTAATAAADDDDGVRHERAPRLWRATDVVRRPARLRHRGRGLLRTTEQRFPVIAAFMPSSLPPSAAAGRAAADMRL